MAGRGNARDAACPVGGPPMSSWTGGDAPTTVSAGATWRHALRRLDAMP
ncbi:hypothetical protein [Amycolatopsis sp. NPDC052450]